MVTYNIFKKFLEMETISRVGSKFKSFMNSVEDWAFDGTVHQNLFHSDKL
jgi:hypothetical protein